MGVFIPVGRVPRKDGGRHQWGPLARCHTAEGNMQAWVEQNNLIKLCPQGLLLAEVMLMVVYYLRVYFG